MLMLAMQKKLWQESAGNDIILSGDGRNDSSGHCAQYCTYSLADINGKKSHSTTECGRCSGD